MRQLLTLILICQMVLQPLLQDRAYADIPVGPSPAITSTVAPAPESPAAIKQQIHDALIGPYLEAVEKSKTIPSELDMTEDDPALDRDPFFLGEQDWHQEGSAVTEISTAEDESSVDLVVPGTNLTWTLHQPLATLATADDYVFFRAKDNFAGFDQESRGLSQRGEGMFFISHSEFLKAASQRVRVPVCFFPLPGNGWQGSQGAPHPQRPMQASYFAQDEILTVTSSDGDTLPIQMDDVRSIHKFCRNNLFLSQVMSASRNNGGELLSMDLGNVVANAGITANFGLLFTGFDFKNPENSVFKFQTGQSFAHFLKKIFLPERAEALGIDADLQWRLIRIAEVVGANLAWALVLKLGFWRERYRQRNEAYPLQGTWANIKRGAVDTGNIFAANLTTFNKFAPVWFANGVEFVADRFFPAFAAGSNSKVRNFLERRIFFIRGTSAKLPATFKSFLSGLEITSVDTMFYGDQLYSVNEHISNGIVHEVPALASRVHDAYHNNENVDNMKLNEVEGNLQAGVMSAPTSWAENFVAQNLRRIEAQVRSEMENAGQDPEANPKLFKRLVSEQLTRDMKRMGSEGNPQVAAAAAAAGMSTTEFLFNANTLYKQTINLLGYTVPPDALNAQIDAEDFRGAERPGLIISSLKESIRRLKNGAGPPYAGSRAAALEFLNGLWKDMSLLSVFAKSPYEAIFPDGNPVMKVASRFEYYAQRYKAAQLGLMILTYQGNLDNVRNALPRAWKSLDQQAFELAANTFRDVLGNFLVGPPVAKTAFAPAKRDFVARWQEKRAMKKASEIYFSQKNEAFNPAIASEEQKATFKNIYAEVLVKMMGLFPDFKTEQPPEYLVNVSGSQWEPRDNLGLEAKVIALASKATAREMADPDVQEYFKGQDPIKKIQYEASLHACNFIAAYNKVFADTPEVSAISPSQTGRLQKFRQRRAVRENMFLTRTARALEAMVPNDRYGLGKTAWFDRNIPAWYLIKQANIRTYANLIPRVTVMYAWNDVIFHLNSSASNVALATLTAFTVGAPIQAINNFFANQGWKPMGSFKGTLLYTVILSWATFWGSIPEQIFNKDFTHLFDFLVKEHPAETLAAAAAAVSAVNVRQKVLAGVKDKWQLLKARVKGSCRDNMESF